MRDKRIACLLLQYHLSTPSLPLPLAAERTTNHQLQLGREQDSVNLGLVTGDVSTSLVVGRGGGVRALRRAQLHRNSKQVACSRAV